MAKPAIQIASKTTRIPLFISIIVVIGALLSIAGAVISKVDPILLTSGAPITDATRVYADYMFARSLSLAAMLLFLLLLKNRRMLAGFMVLVAIIQLLDVLDDITRGAFLLAPGLLVFALVFLFGAQNLFGHALWRIETWRDSEPK